MEVPYSDDGTLVFVVDEDDYLGFIFFDASTLAITQEFSLYDSDLEYYPTQYVEFTNCLPTYFCMVMSIKDQDEPDELGFLLVEMNMPSYSSMNSYAMAMDSFMNNP